jgi:hypothetical protein
VPRAATTNEKDEKTSRDNFIAGLFFAGVNTKNYGKLETKLNNAYVVDVHSDPLC